MQVRVSRRVVGPDTVITSGPTTPTAPSRSSIRGGSADGCDLRVRARWTAAFNPCSTSPCTSPALVDGSQRFGVRAADASGTDSTPASRAFLVDRTAPNAQIKLNGAAPLPWPYLTGVVVDVAATDLTPARASQPSLPGRPVEPAVDARGLRCRPLRRQGRHQRPNHTAYGDRGRQGRQHEHDRQRDVLHRAGTDTAITSGPGATTYSAPSFTFVSIPAGARFEAASTASVPGLHVAVGRVRPAARSARSASAPSALTARPIRRRRATTSSWRKA